jgi:hypothetical protein
VRDLENWVRRFLSPPLYSSYTVYSTTLHIDLHTFL